MRLRLFKIRERGCHLLLRLKYRQARRGLRRIRVRILQVVVDQLRILRSCKLIIKNLSNLIIEPAHNVLEFLVFK
jgi:hypothetical protein